MRGTDRCEEIIRLIDETIGGPPAAAGAPGGSVPAPPDATDRQRLLAAVADFLAGSLTDNLGVAG